MITITSAQIDVWLASFIWPLTRILGVIMAAPILGEHSFPIRIKIGLGVLITFLVVPTLAPSPQINPSSLIGLLILLQEFLIGAAMGFVIRIIFAGAQLGGELIGLQMGLGFATFFDPQTEGNTLVMSQFFELFATLVFLSINGHLIIISVLSDSFSLFPITNESINAITWKTIVDWGANIFIAGFSLALPIVAALLITNIGLGTLARTSPQLNIFAIGFPITLLIGFLILALSLPYIIPNIQHLVEETLYLMKTLWIR